MKPTNMILGAVMMTALASASFSQSSANGGGRQAAAGFNYRADAVNQIEKNYLACLACSNSAVVQSAIAQSVRLKWAVPSAQLEDLKTKLSSLAIDGNTIAIRYKAYLAEMVYDTPSLFSGEIGTMYAEDEDLFNAISVKAQGALLGDNTDNAAGR